MMKSLLVIALSAISLNAHAIGSPQYVSLNNVVEFGKYVDANMQTIVESSVLLAKNSIVSKNYFLITESISMNTYSHEADQGEKPFASILMRAGDLVCVRNVFTKVTANEWGEQRKMNFSLDDEISCEQRKSN